VPDRKHLSYANVVATIALFGVVAGGGAYAASKIGTSDIRPKAVTEKKLANDAVTSRKIASEAVGNDELSPSSSGIALAGVTYGDGVRTYFNRFGGKPIVDHIGPGMYAIYFPGFEDYNFPGAVESATLLDNPIGGGEVGVYEEGCSGLCLPVHPVVVTRNSAGNKADSSFSYLLFDALP
jgi:hypothetical protein